jgi:NADPH-dependent ferric siderophore reductase
MFVIDQQRRLHVITPDRSVEPRHGEVLVSFVPEHETRDVPMASESSALPAIADAAAPLPAARNA